MAGNGDRRVTKLYRYLLYAIPVAAFAGHAAAQTQELGLVLGGHLSTDRTSSSGTPLRLGGDIALEANYEHRLMGLGPAALYLGVEFLASESRGITSLDRTATRDLATIYLAPNVMVKVFPHSRITPWGTIGGGLAVYEQSKFEINGLANTAVRDVNHGAFMIGGGIDYKVWHFVSLRGEVREFYTGSPAYNLPLSGGQNNVVAGGGIVLRLGK